MVCQSSVCSSPSMNPESCGRRPLLETDSSPGIRCSRVATRALRALVASDSVVLASTRSVERVPTVSSRVLMRPPTAVTSVVSRSTAVPRSVLTELRSDVTAPSYDLTAPSSDLTAPRSDLIAVLSLTMRAARCWNARVESGGRPRNAAGRMSPSGAKMSGWAVVAGRTVVVVWVNADSAASTAESNEGEPGREAVSEVGGIELWWAVAAASAMATASAAWRSIWAAAAASSSSVRCCGVRSTPIPCVVQRRSVGGPVGRGGGGGGATDGDRVRVVVRGAVERAAVGPVPMGAPSGGRAPLATSPVGGEGCRVPPSVGEGWCLPPMGMGGGGSPPHITSRSAGVSVGTAGEGARGDVPAGAAPSATGSAPSCGGGDPAVVPTSARPRSSSCPRSWAWRGPGGSSSEGSTRNG